VNVRAFRLTTEKVGELKAILREYGLSRRDCWLAVAAVKKWLQPHAEAPDHTPSDLVVPDEIPHPKEHDNGAEDHVSTLVR
jgi:hypothetical protein